MRRIVCYGDSNTWGFDPRSYQEDRGYFLRYDENTRWTFLLRKMLGDAYDLIEEGAGGRTTVLDDPINFEQLNGYKYLVPCLFSHMPVDLVIIMLGTNDLKSYFSATAASIAYGNELLMKTIKKSNYGPAGNPPDVLLICPVSLTEGFEDSCIRDLFDVKSAIARSRELPPLMEQAALRNGCHFMKADDYVTVSDIDHVHFTPESHRRFAEAVYEKLLGIYGK